MGSQDRRVRRGVTGAAFACCSVVLVLVGCTADDFHELAEGDCTHGNPRVEGDLERIDCEEFSSSNPEHRRVAKVIEDDVNGECPLGSSGYEDRDRVVCFRNR